MGIDVVTLAVAKKYTKDSVAGAGAVAGVPCKIQSITAITGGNRVTFLWTDNNGDDHTSTMDVMNGDKGETGETGATGTGIKSMAINGSKHLIVTYTDNTTQDAGEIPQVQADWDEDDSTADAFIKNKPALGTAAAKDYTPNVAPNNHNLVESNAVYNAINTALTSVYTPRGELSCAELTSSLLIAANVGNIYEMSDSGTTSDLFLQGAGVAISAGSNVGIIQTGVDTFKFNLMANSFDLHNYQTKVEDATAGNFAGLDANGQTTDSGKKAADFATAQGLTDQVNAFKGNLNANGSKNIFVLDLAEIQLVSTNMTDGTWLKNAYTKHGATFTINEDNIVFSGTPTNNAGIHIRLKNIKPARYILSGMADCVNVVWGNYTLLKNGSNVTTVSQFSKTDRDIDLSSYDFDTFDIEIKRDQNNTAISGAMYPMMCLKSDFDVDSTWTEAAKTNRQLTDDCLDYEDMSKLGSVNGLDNIAVTTVSSASGITATVNNDKSITFSATSGEYPYTLPQRIIIDVTKAKPDFPFFPCKLSGCPAGGNSDFGSGYQIYYANYMDANGVVVDAGEGAIVSGEFDRTTYPNARIMIRINAGVTLSGPLTFKPMLTSVSYNGPYVPYAMTNRELTEITTVTATENSTYVSDSYLTFAKVGRLVSATGYFVVETAAARYETLFTLSERPKSYGSGNTYLLAVNNAGNVILLKFDNQYLKVESTGGIAAGGYALIGSFYV